MRRIFTKYQTIFEIIFLLLFGLIPLLWYGTGEMALGHDMGFPLAPIDHFTDRLYLWTNRIGSFGSNQSESINGFFIHGLEAALSYLGFSLINTQKISFVIWMFLPGLSMYLLLRSIEPQKDRWIFRITGSLFYMMNHFFLQAWFIAERTKFSAATALPLLILLTINALFKGKSLLFNGILFGLVLLFFNAGPGIPLYAGIGLGVGISILILTLIGVNKTNFIRKFSRSLGFSLIAIITIAILNFYWISPLFQYSLGNFSDRVGQAGGAEGAINWSHEISKNSSFMNLIRLQGIPDWYGNLEHPYANEFLNNPILIGISFLFPVLVAAGFYLTKKNSTRASNLLPLFGLMLLVGIFFTSGSHPPLGFMYDFMIRNVPGFSVLRTPFYKFGLILWFSYAFLVAWGLQQVVYTSQTSRKKIVRFISFLLFPIFVVIYALYNYPYFTGSFFDWSKKYSTMVTVPDYVFEFKNWIDNNQSDSRVLLVPSVDPNTKYETYDWGYFSLSTIPTILTRKSVVSNDAYSKQNEEILINTLYDRIYEDLDYSFAKYLGVNYLLLRDDFASAENGNYKWKELVKNIPESEKYERISDYDSWDLYRFTGLDETMEVYASSDNTYIDSQLADISKAIAIPWVDIGDSFFVSETQQQFYPGADLYRSNIVKGVCKSCIVETKVSIKPSPVRNFAQSRLAYYVERKLEQSRVNDITNPESLIDFKIGNTLKKEALVTSIVNRSKDADLVNTIFIDIYQDITDAVEIHHKIDSPERKKYYQKRIKSHVDYLNSRLSNFIDSNVSIDIDAKSKDLKWKLSNLELIEEETVPLPEGLYSFNVPVEGTYNLYVYQPSPVIVEQPSSIQITQNDAITSRQMNKIEDEWLDLGEFIFEAGSNEIVVPLIRESTVDGLEQVFDINSPIGKSTCEVITFPNENNVIYNISFLYRTEIGEPIHIRLVQDTDSKDPQKRPYFVIDGTVGKDASWRRFNQDFRPNKYTSSADLELCIASNDKENSEVQIDQFKVTAHADPTIFITNSDYTPQEGRLFTRYSKVDPTTYIVSVHNPSQAPYVLNLNQRFDNGWKLYKTESVYDIWSEENMISKNVNGSKHWPSKEFSSTEIQLLENEPQHFLNNGYNNAWIMDGTQNEFVLKYKPQSDMSKAVLVSVTGLTIVIAILIIARKTNNEKSYH